MGEGRHEKQGGAIIERGGQGGWRGRGRRQICIQGLGY